MNAIHLIIKGTKEQAQAALRERGFHPTDQLTPLRSHPHRPEVYVTVSGECEPGAVRWLCEPDRGSPGALLHYSRNAEPPVPPLEPKPLSQWSDHECIAYLCFVAESLAHLQGRERDLLPVTERVRSWLAGPAAIPAREEP